VRRSARRSPSERSSRREEAHCSEVGGRRSEVGGRRSEVGGRRSDVGRRRSEVGHPLVPSQPDFSFQLSTFPCRRSLGPLVLWSFGPLVPSQPNFSFQLSSLSFSASSRDLPAEHAEHAENTSASICVIATSDVGCPTSDLRPRTSDLGRQSSVFFRKHVVEVALLLSGD
jgi:hypothetical protein